MSISAATAKSIAKPSKNESTERAHHQGNGMAKVTCGMIRPKSCPTDKDKGKGEEISASGSARGKR
jgi:hypothetical protein